MPVTKKGFDERCGPGVLEAKPGHSSRLPWNTVHWKCMTAAR